MTVSGNSFVLRTSRRNFSTRLRAAGLQPEQTRQKSRMLATYSLPGMTRSKLCASNGSLFMSRAANARFRIGHATNSVVPGATVVSMSTRHCAGIFCPMVRIVASSAAMSASPSLRRRWTKTKPKCNINQSFRLTHALAQQKWSGHRA